MFSMQINLIKNIYEENSCGCVLSCDIMMKGLAYICLYWIENVHILLSGYVKNIYKETDKILVIHAQEYPTIPAAPYPCKYFIKQKRT